MESERPAPEEFLARAAREEERERRGTLRIYFGAAPGVGKTYAMLEAARARRRGGADVVIGWVETHGRRETEELARGFERLPPRRVEYRGVELCEFDLDAALERRPGILVLDELAHTNAAGSRHARRWQDVLELLEAGIEVHTTLNVQHVESLNDLVAEITGVRVRETVPDSLFDRADDIELVDLPPDDLLERLRAGKVYVPAQAARAVESFFRKENLLALRELALRRTAERVDAQSAEWRRDHGLARAEGLRERLLVAVGPSPSSANVVRAAYHMAERLRAPWIALSVETPSIEHLPAEQRERLASSLELAVRLGAESLIVRGEDLAEEILAVARERGATRIVLGKPSGRSFAWLRRSLVVARIVSGSGPAEVVLTRGEGKPTRRTRRPRERLTAAQLLFALAVVALCTGLCFATRSYLSLADQAMLYLLGVLVVASRTPRLPSLATAVASVLALDFFFVPPFYTFAVDDFRYAITFAVMLVVALTTSTFTVRLREHAQAARQRERRSAALYAMSSSFVIETGVGEIAETAIHHVRDVVETDAFVLIADRAGNLIPAGGRNAALSERELAVASWVFEHGRVAGFATDTLPSAECVYVPLVGSRGHLGVFGVALGRRSSPLSPFQWQVLETFVAQTALALERALLVQQNALAQVQMETERTRSELLSAVTHDVRTPLSTIGGAAETLLHPTSELDEAARRELLELVRDETQRLSRLIGDLLDLTRIESGAVTVIKSPYPIEDLLESALARLDAELAGRAIVRGVPEEVLVAAVDPILLEQVFVNLLENAAKYSPSGTPLEVRLRAEPPHLVIEIADRGPGIPAGQEERIFERFYRAADGARAEGTGLGLTVSRAIVRAHGGTLVGANRPDGGALFRVVLPLAETPATANATSPKEIGGP